jgi:hypothetical protein
MIAEVIAPRKPRRTSPALWAYEQAGQYIVSPATPEANDWDVIKRDGTHYRVDLDGPRCNCPAFRGRRTPGTCKHVELVKLHVAADAPAPVPAAPARRTFSDAEKAALLSLWD